MLLLPGFVHGFTLGALIFALSALVTVGWPQLWWLALVCSMVGTVFLGIDWNADQSSARQMFEWVVFNSVAGPGFAKWATRVRGPRAKAE